MAVDDVYQIAVDQTLHGILLTNLFHYKQLVGGSGDDEQDLIDAFAEDVQPAWEAALSLDWSITCYRSRQVSGSGAFPETLEVVTGAVGDLTGNAFPANAVAVISWYSQTYSKAGRGRSFFSGIRMDDEHENTWQAAQMTLLNLLGAALVGTITDSVSGGSFESVIWGGSPATSKKIVKREVRPQVRKLINRTNKSCVTA